MNDEYNSDNEIDIIDIISSTCKNNIKARINMLQDVYDETKDSKYKNEINNLCEQHGLCKKCFNKLSVKEYTESREYMGFPCNETFYKTYCEYC